MLALSALSLLATASLEQALSAFADCEASAAREKIASRLAFFKASGLHSEEAVRALPEHVARNYQETVLGLQDQLLPEGARVRIDGLIESSMHGCEGTLITCLRDGTFVCAVEITQCADAASQPDGLPVSARVRVVDLRPATGCNVAAVPAPCAEGVDGGTRSSASAPTPLTDAVIGQMMADTVATHRQLSASGSLPPAAAALGSTAFPDLSYAALLMVCTQLHWASCHAHAHADLDGARAAVDKCLELEAQSRPSGLSPWEVPHALRVALAQLHALSSALFASEGAASDAREAALVALRLNVTATVCPRKLRRALSRAPQLRMPTGYAGLAAPEVRRLRQWWNEELAPLDKQATARGQQVGQRDAESARTNGGQEWGPPQPQRHGAAGSQLPTPPPLKSCAAADS